MSAGTMRERFRLRFRPSLPVRVCADRVCHEGWAGSALASPVIWKMRRMRAVLITSASRSAGLAEPFEAADEGSQAGGVEEVYAAQVGDEVHGTLGRKLADLFAQHRRGVDVDLAGHLEDGAIADRPGGLQVELAHVRLRSAACHYSN